MIDRFTTHISPSYASTTQEDLTLPLVRHCDGVAQLFRLTQNTPTNFFVGLFRRLPSSRPARQARGTGGRGFEPRRSDQYNQALFYIYKGADLPRKSAGEALGKL